MVSAPPSPFVGCGVCSLRRCTGFASLKRGHTQVERLEVGSSLNGPRYHINYTTTHMLRQARLLSANRLSMITGIAHSASSLVPTACRLARPWWANSTAFSLPSELLHFRPDCWGDSRIAPGAATRPSCKRNRWAPGCWARRCALCPWKLPCGRVSLGMVDCRLNDGNIGRSAFSQGRAIELPAFHGHTPGCAFDLIHFSRGRL